MKKTAVEWLEKELNYIEENAYTSYIDLKIKQAKKMEKQQIIDAYESLEHRHGENYYNETFKKTEQ